MTWDSVPWFVGGGAEHSPEVARLLAYAATNGAEGIVSPGDLKVAPLDVPGTSVRVLTGAALILNRAQSGDHQTYVGRLPVEDVVAIASTGSGAGRSDLIVAEIMDPFVPGSSFQTPDDVKVGPYIRTRVISNVAAGTTTVPAGITGVALARIDLPASTGTVTADLIKDLRHLAQPRAMSRVYGGPPGGTQVWTPASTAAWGDPYGMASLGFIPPVEVPAWATHMDLIFTASVQTIAGSSGATHTKFGNDSSLRGPTINWDGDLNDLTCADIGRAIPANFRGTTQQSGFGIRVDAGQLAIIGWAFQAFTFNFYERAV